MSVYEVTNVNDFTSTNLNLFFPVGLPEGHENVRAGVTFEPKFMMVSPNSGTPGSTLITATVPGIGTQTSTKDLDIIDQTGRTICREDPTILEYGVIQCWTRREEYKDVFEVRVKNGDNIYECVTENKEKCQYVQHNDEGTFPKVKSLEMVGNTLVYTGEAFYTAGYTVTASYKSILATSVVVDSDTQATATFEGGIPIWTKTDQERSERANLNFELQGTGEDEAKIIFKAINTGDAINDFVNPFTLGSSTAGASCSFNGGCPISVTGTPGIQTLFRENPKENYINVCEQRCEYDDAASSAGEIVCNLAAVPTTYSNQNFQVGRVEKELNSGVYFGVSDANIAFDGSIFTRVDDNAATCQLGMEFKEGYVGSLQQVKYFINYISDRAQYENNLVFEGYNERDAAGEGVTEIFRVEGEVHEGWNYVDFEEGEYPNFRFYRMRGLGNKAGACRIHEITFTGLEVIQNEEDTY